MANQDASVYQRLRSFVDPEKSSHGRVFDGASLDVAAGWSLQEVTPPSRLTGSGGMTVGPDGRLYVAENYASQVTAVDVETGDHETFSPAGSAIFAPDDVIFGADGTFYATEPWLGRVSARNADGSYRVVRDDLPDANGITMDHERRRLFVDECRAGGRLIEVDPHGEREPRVLMEDLNGPNAISMGPDGRLYFPLLFANEIWAYDLEASRGNALFKDLSVPTAVKFDSGGRLLVSEAGTGHITAIDLQTGRRETVVEVAPCIDNLFVGQGDRIFVSNFLDGLVAEETANTHRILLNPGLLGPYGLSVASGGRLLVADGLSVASVDGEGGIERVLRILIDFHTVVVAVCEWGDDLAVLTLTGEVLLYREGRSDPRVLVEGLDGPTCMLAESPGSLLVVERAGGRLVRIHRDGKKQPLATSLRSPGAVCEDMKGNLYLTQADSGAVVVLMSDGGRQEIPGFEDAQGIAIAGDTLLIADVGAQKMVAVNIKTGLKDVVVCRIPLGPRVGVAPAPFCSVCPDGRGGFYVGCNGDGSIRRLSL